jgi:hypothetical protein
MTYACNELVYWQEQCVNWDHGNVELEVQTIEVCYDSNQLMSFHPSTIKFPDQKL